MLDFVVWVGICCWLGFIDWLAFSRWFLVWCYLVGWVWCFGCLFSDFVFILLIYLLVIVLFACRTMLFWVVWFDVLTLRVAGL